MRKAIKNWGKFVVNLRKFGGLQAGLSAVSRVNSTCPVGESPVFYTTIWVVFRDFFHGQKERFTSVLFGLFHTIHNTYNKLQLNKLNTLLLIAGV